MATPKKNTPAAAPAQPAVTNTVPAPQPAPAPVVATGDAAAFAAGAAPAPSSKWKFAIETGIPMPEKRIGPKGESAYPFAGLEVGQSFFVPMSDEMKEPWRTMTSMSSRVSRELHPKKFGTARIKDDATGVEGCRVWRVADSTEPLQPPRKKAPKQTEGATQTEAPSEGGQENNDNTEQPADPFTQPAA